MDGFDDTLNSEASLKNHSSFTFVLLSSYYVVVILLNSCV